MVYHTKTNILTTQIAILLKKQKGDFIMSDPRNPKAVPTKSSRSIHNNEFGNIPTEDNYDDGDIPEIDLPMNSEYQLHNQTLKDLLR